MLTQQMVVAVMPDGPIAFDGQAYRYSKGERLYLDNLARYFKEVWLICLVFREGDTGYETCLHSSFEATNIRVIELPMPRMSNGEVGVLAKAFQFLREFRILLGAVPKTDLMYLFLPSYHSALGWVVARMFRKPHIAYGADDWVQASESMFKWSRLRYSWFYRMYARINQVMERLIVGSAKFAVAAGGQLQKKYADFGCLVYPTSPRMTLTRSDVLNRSDTCDKEQQITLVTVGALVHDKAQHLLLDALAKLLPRFPHMALQIVGAGPERERLELAARTLNVSHAVEFKGYVEDEHELYSLLGNADIFVLSSVTEGFPRALYEAMAMRLPIVTTAVGGIPYLLRDRENARVVPSGDSTGLANAVAEIITDGDQRRRLIRAGASTLEEVFDRVDSGQIARLVDKWLATEQRRP